MYWDKDYFLWNIKKDIPRLEQRCIKKGQHTIGVQCGYALCSHKYTFPAEALCLYSSLFLESGVTFQEEMDQYVGQVVYTLPPHLLNDTIWN